MELKYYEPIYYHALYNKICEIPCGEIPLNHKNEEEKAKFENHICHWASCDEFRVFNFYLEFSDDYSVLKKVEYPYNRMAVDYPDDLFIHNPQQKNGAESIPLRQ